MSDPTPPSSGANAAARAAEFVARGAYGRLMALLASRTRDLASAEDALADAFALALTTWPRDGVPERPEAWLLTTARRRLIDAGRRRRVEHEARPKLAAAEEVLMSMDTEAADIPDERLKLLFVCAHPALDEAVRTPLMLQSVMGLEAARIAEVFVVSPAAMAQRLVRAKVKLRDAGVRFDVPSGDELAARLDAVLQSIYAAFTAGWSDPASAETGRHELSEEAVWLGRTLVELMPDEPEVRGLLALMLFSESRRDARRDAGGRFVPLSEQRTELWSESMLEDAEAMLESAAEMNRPGPFQLEAAIQAIHAHRRHAGGTSWPAIVNLYEALRVLSPTLGGSVALAAARCEAGSPRGALAELDALEPAAVASYQPYWATRAAALAGLGRTVEARAAAERAAALSPDPAVREWLRERY